jgi:hypothetical protein
MQVRVEVGDGVRIVRTASANRRKNTAAGFVMAERSSVSSAAAMSGSTCGFAGVTRPGSLHEPWVPSRGLTFQRLYVLCHQATCSSVD